MIFSKDAAEVMCLPTASDWGPDGSAHDTSFGPLVQVTGDGFLHSEITNFAL